MNTEKEVKKDENEIESDTCWILFILIMFVFRGDYGFNNQKIKELDTRVSKLEAKNELIEKLITK